jgi:hypothetical protein
MVLAQYLHEGTTFLLGFGMAMQYLGLRFNRYVMEPKGFLIYPKRGIAHALSNNFGHEQYPFNSLHQKHSFHGVYKYFHKSITFLLV